jgi:uncharacterized membrane protein HdeD (DUF308 family)
LADLSTRQSFVGIVPWWTVLLEGVAALIVGLLLLSAPVFTLVAAVQVLGVYWLVIGIISIVSIFADRTSWGWKLIWGVLGITTGIAVLEYPLLSAILVPETLILYIAVLGIIIGLMSLYRAYSSRSWEHAVTGVISILFGLLVIANPLAATIALTYALGAIGVVGGIIAIAGALSLRSAQKHLESRRLETAPGGRAMPSMGAGPELSESATERDETK